MIFDVDCEWQEGPDQVKISGQSILGGVKKKGEGSL